MKWYWWLMIGILLLIVVAAIYKVNVNNKAKNKLPINGDKCILSTDGNGMWLNGKCVSNADYISSISISN